MQNSTFDPANIDQYVKGKNKKAAKGVSQTCEALETTNIDLLLTDDVLLASGSLTCIGATSGDKVHFQIIAVDGEDETIVDQYVTDWFINSTTAKQEVPRSSVPAKIPAGMVIRLVYVSTGGDVWVAVNYDLEEILI